LSTPHNPFILSFKDPTPKKQIFRQDKKGFTGFFYFMKENSEPESGFTVFIFYK